MKKVLAVLAVFVCLQLPLFAADDGQLRKTFGTASGQGLFAQYMAIGHLADLHVAKSYDSDKTVKLAKLYGQICQNAKESMQDLLKSKELSAGDAKYVARFVEINDLLITLSQELVNYTEDGSDTNARKFEAARQAAWKQVSDLMGMAE